MLPTTRCENRINWPTACLSCAKCLQFSTRIDPHAATSSGRLHAHGWHITHTHHPPNPSSSWHLGTTQPCHHLLKLRNYKLGGGPAFNRSYSILEGRDSFVGISTHHRMEGPGIESRWRRDFLRKSIPALGPTQPPIQWVPGLSSGGKATGA